MDNLAQLMNVIGAMVTTPDDIRRPAPGGGAGVLVVLAFALLAGGAGPAAGQPLTEAPAEIRSETHARFAAKPFPLGQVDLLDSPFREALRRDVDYLLRLEPDRLLHNVHDLAGLEAKAPRYGGWESMQIAGHSLGHYLSALSLYHAKRSGDDVNQQIRARRVEERIHYIVDELARVQDARGTGYVGGISGQEALWQEMLDTEHGGMNESLANLYAITGDTRSTGKPTLPTPRTSPPSFPTHPPFDSVINSARYLPVRLLMPAGLLLVGTTAAQARHVDGPVHEPVVIE